MPKVLYLLGRFPAWSETFIAREMRLLNKAEFPFLPVALKSGTGSLPEDLPSVHILKPATAADSGEKEIKGSMTGSFRRRASLLKHANLKHGLIRYAREHAVTHLHSTFADLPGLLISAAARKLHLPYSISLHARDALCPKYDEDFLFRQASFLTVCNQRVHDVLTRRNPELASRLHFIPHGIPLDRWPFSTTVWQPSQPVLKLLFVGRLVAKKAPAMAMQIADALSNQGISCQLTVIGDGPLKSTLTSPTLQLKGIVRPDEIRHAMQTHDCLLVSSQEMPDGDMEGLPNVVLEAMATGLPVVAFPSGSMLEVVNKETAFMPQRYTVDSYCETICTMLRQPEAIEPKRHAARTRIEHAYCANTLIQQRIALFNQHLA